MSIKRLSPAATNALQEALCSIYWYKNDLRRFLTACIKDSAIVNSLNWSNYKREIVGHLIDTLTKDPDRHLNDLTKLCYEVTGISSFFHLEKLEDGQRKVRQAELAVEQLRQLVKPHQDEKRDREKYEQRQRESKGKLESTQSFRKKLSELNSNFAAIIEKTSPQQKGLDLERLMYDLFELFDLDPKASFKNSGEQIDGAFSLEGGDYLFEAKWHQSPIGRGDLDVFTQKISRKLENTLGVFLSMSGFSSTGISAHASTQPRIILMDGADLMAVLEERIDFVTLLRRKKRYAAETGNIYLKIDAVLR